MSKGQKKTAYTMPGVVTTPKDVTAFIEHVNNINYKAALEGKQRTPAVIWGPKGISKTSIVKQYALNVLGGYKYIAGGEVEESGDITGIPKSAVVMYKDGVNGREYAKVVIDTVPAYSAQGWSVDPDKPATTINLPPSWVPIEGVDPERGILLIDDFNRAPRNVQQTLMQLLQEYKMNSSWAIPAGWDIVLTGNPTGGDYDVEELDPAQLTRMLSIGMQFDAKEWAIWAESAGVDSRGINFVLTYPEMVIGERTCPRTLVQFFDLIKPIEKIDNEQGINLANIYGHSCLDKETVNAFQSFITQGLTKLMSAEEMLSGNFATTETFLKKYMGETKRIDILGTLMHRLYMYIANRNKAEGSAFMSKTEIENLTKIISIKDMPADLLFDLGKSLISLNQSMLNIFKSNPTIAQQILKSMSGK